VVQEYATGRSSNLYKNNEWQQTTHTFKDYGSNVRKISVVSTGNRCRICILSKLLTGDILGQDDKHWGGHYGPIISSAIVRVKREVAVAEGDAFEDVIPSLAQSKADGRSAQNDRLVVKVLEQCKKMLDEQSQSKVMKKYLHYL
jgi:hypothetical protein